MEIETDRLILRRSRLVDVPALFEFLGNPDAMGYTQCDASLRRCRRRVAVHEWHRRHDGYAPWTVVSRADGKIIGWGGLYNDPFDPGWGVEIGYHFHPEAWGRGYATELAIASLVVADHELRLPETSAFAHPDNARSRRVLEKVGFKRERFVETMNRDLFRRVRGGVLAL